VWRGPAEPIAEVSITQQRHLDGQVVCKRIVLSQQRGGLASEPGATTPGPSDIALYERHAKIALELAHFAPRASIREPHRRGSLRQRAAVADESQQAGAIVAEHQPAVFFQPELDVRFHRSTLVNGDCVPRGSTSSYRLDAHAAPALA